MSIASRIEAIEEHLTDDYSVLELAGADLTNVDKNIINLKPTWKERLLYFMNNGTDVVWNNWDKVTGEGTSLSLNNTLEGKMKIDLKGNTSQEGTPTPETPQDIHVVSGDNSIEVCGVNLLQKQGYGTPYSDSTYWLGSPNWLTSGDDGWATFSVDNSSGSSVAYKNMMIKSGNVKYKPSTDYTIFVELDDLSLDNATGDMLYLSQGGNAQDPFNSGQKFITYAQAPNKVFKFNVTTKADLTNAIAFRTFAVVPAGKNVSYKIRAMIVEGNYEKNTYESYTGESYPINLGNIELCKIGDYQDSIVKDNGKWYLNKQIGKVVLDGSETGWSNLSMGANYKRTDVLLPYTPMNTGSRVYCLSNYFLYNNSYNTDTIGSCFISTVDNKIYVYPEQQDTLENFKTWLSTHNTIAYYVLATPTYTEITDSTLLSQLNALAKSYASQTNISQESNDLPFILTTTALREMA